VLQIEGCGFKTQLGLQLPVDPKLASDHMAATVAEIIEGSLYLKNHDRLIDFFSNFLPLFDCVLKCSL
jgi:hypothetical protein